MTTLTPALSKFPPSNVVRVPEDSFFQKLRVCEYKVLAEVTTRLEEDEKDGWDKGW